MARIDLLVNGVKHRFVLSTGASDSIFPECLVPPGRLMKEGEIRLRTISNNDFNTCGLYETVLESPDMDFCLPFTLNVVKSTIPILGNDFLQKSQCGVFSPRYIEVVNQRGIAMRLPLTIQRGPEENGAFLVPAMHRVPMEATPPSQPNRTVVAKNVIFFHLETTGFGNDAEIIQIAASCRRKTFNVYILPAGDIHCKATERNGFTKQGGRLFLRGQAVRVTPRQQALENFVAFLRSVGGKAVLAAHNAMPFHAPLLTTLLTSLGLDKQFKAQVRGLADTLPLFRKALSDREAARNSFALDDLAKDLLAEVPVNAEEAVATLEQLILKVGISYKEVIQAATQVTKFFDS